MTAPPRQTAQFSLPLGGDLDPVGVFERLCGEHAPWLLESALPLPEIGRFSFAGADPYLVLRARGLALELECRRAVHGGLVPGVTSSVGPTLPALRALMPAAPPCDPGIPFCGGAVGVFGYELAEQLDVHRLHGTDDLGLPDAVWLFVDAIVAFDHERGSTLVSGLGFSVDAGRARERAEIAARSLARKLERPTTRRPRGSRPLERREASDRDDVEIGGYRKAVEHIGEQIAAGRIYQACLTYRVDRSFEGDPWRLYRALRRRDPAPFAAYFALPEVAITSSSPERFLRVDADGGVESRPIKGTASRGAHPAEDAARRRALACSDKDRAENVMIVDLVRNDLGRVCEPGTIAVPGIFSVEPYASVFQLVSTVRGRLRREHDALDAVAATFPPGSMTGAPKIAAMRVLDGLETVRRGFYSGALGYLDVRGGADLCVVIRTALVRRGRVYLHTGGGIVADSTPEAEYAEARAKLRSLRAAIDDCG